MQCVTDGATGKLVGDQRFLHQLVVQRFRDGIIDNQRVPGTQAITCEKSVIDFGFDIHQRLVDTHYPAACINVVLSGL